MIKKIIISTLCIAAILLSACEAESSVDKPAASSITDSSSNTNKDNRIEYDNKVMYDSSLYGFKISLNAIQMCHKGNDYHDNDPYDAVKIELLVESYGKYDIRSYGDHFISINGRWIAIGTADEWLNKETEFFVGKQTKTIVSFSIPKEKLDYCGFNQIEKISLADTRVEVGEFLKAYGSDSEIKLKYAEANLYSSPYKLKWK